MCRACAGGVCIQPVTDACRSLPRPYRLPPIEEAWNKNTSSEMSRETQKLQPAAQAAKLAQQQQQVREGSAVRAGPRSDGFDGAASWVIREDREL